MAVPTMYEWNVIEKPVWMLTMNLFKHMDFCSLYDDVYMYRQATGVSTWCVCYVWNRLYKLKMLLLSYMYYVCSLFSFNYQGALFRMNSIICFIVLFFSVWLLFWWWKLQLMICLLLKGLFINQIQDRKFGIIISFVEVSTKFNWITSSRWFVFVENKPE